MNKQQHIHLQKKTGGNFFVLINQLMNAISIMDANAMEFIHLNDHP
jgi:hypothetical protein